MEIQTLTKLSVNLNKVALLRNARDLDIPSVIKAANTCIQAGCHGITVHPRPDERHIRRQDVYDLHGLAAMADVEFNIEGNPFPQFIELVRTIKPDQCTLVPDSPDQNTSDHGWDLDAEGDRIAPIVAELKELGIRVSLFLDPVDKVVQRAKEVGADRIELYTEPYARAHAEADPDQVLNRYVHAAEAAHAIGLGVNAGHDLNLHNLGAFCNAVPGVAEVSIGHALIADALDRGLSQTVRAYLDILSKTS